MIDKDRIHMHTWLIIREGLKRGYDIGVEDYKRGLVRVQDIERKGFKFKLLPSFLCLAARDDYYGMESKIIKKNYLKNSGLQVPATYACIDQIWRVNKSGLKYPLVVKPEIGSLSKNVFVNIQNYEGLVEKFDLVQKKNKNVILEEFIKGNNYRILVIDGKYVGAVERRPANVTGDGKHTISELIEIKNNSGYRNSSRCRNTTNHYLVYDKTSELLLRSYNLTENSILDKGRNVRIQNKITANLGADYIDVSNRIHSSIIDKCEKLAKEIDHLIVGFDLITADLSDVSKYYFNEFNYKPYIDLHENNNIGDRKKVSSLIWNYIEAHYKDIFTSELTGF